MASQVQQLASALALTGSAAAATNTSIVGGMDYHTLQFDYTPGASGNVLTVTIEHRVKGVTDSGWAQESEWNESPAGTWTRTLKQYKFTSTGTTEVPLYMTFEVHTGEVRIKASETGTNGTYNAWLTSSSS